MTAKGAEQLRKFIELRRTQMRSSVAPSLLGTPKMWVIEKEPPVPVRKPPPICLQWLRASRWSTTRSSASAGEIVPVNVTS